MFKVIADLIRNDPKTIYRWKKQNRPIINLLEKYFTKQDLEEFLQTGQVKKMENLKEAQTTNTKNGYTLTLDLTNEQIKKLEELAKTSKIEAESLIRLALIKNGYI